MRRHQRPTCFVLKSDHNSKASFNDKTLLLPVSSLLISLFLSQDIKTTEFTEVAQDSPPYLLDVGVVFGRVLRHQQALAHLNIFDQTPPG